MRNTLFLFALTLPLIGLGQSPSDTLSRFLEPAAVTAVRATERAPFAAETLDAEEIADRNTGQDLPYVLRYTPSVVVTVSRITACEREDATLHCVALV